MHNQKENRPAANGSALEDHSGSDLDHIAEQHRPTERDAAAAMLTAADDLTDQSLTIVADTDFVDPRCRVIVGAIRTMRADGIPVDTGTVAGFMETHSLLEPGPARQSLRSHLAELAADAPVGPAAPYLAGIVVAQASTREILAASSKLTQIAFVDLDDRLDLLRDLFTETAAVIKRAQDAVQPRKTRDGRTGRPVALPTPPELSDAGKVVLAA